MAARRPRMADRLDEVAPAPPPPTNGQANSGRHVFAQEAVEPAGAGVPLEVAVGLIDPAPDNPRSRIDVASPGMKELVASIKELGVLSPVLVIPRGERYALVYGHRRLAASVEAGKATIPVIFSGEQDDVGRQIRMLVENTDREDLSPLDEARAYARLMHLGAARSQRALAKMLHKPQARLSKRLSLLELPEDVQAKIGLPEAEGGIPITAAEELAKLAAEPERVVRAVTQATLAGGLDNAIRREAQAKKRQDEAAELRSQLSKDGITVLEDLKPNRVDGPWPLFRMHWVDVDEHVKGNCHAVMVEGWDGRTVVAYCLNPDAHPEPGAADRDAEQARARAESQAREEAKQAARRLRWEFLGGLVGKGNPDAGAALAVHMLIGGGQGTDYARLDHRALAEVLGLAVDTARGKGAHEAVQAFVCKGTRNAQRALYGAAVVLGEAACDSYYASYDVWARQRAYLRHLEDAGYQLSEGDQAMLAAAEQRMGVEDAEAEAGVDDKEDVDDEEDQ